MKKVMVALAALFLTTACDIRESITGKPAAPESRRNEVKADEGGAGSFWANPYSEKPKYETGKISDYQQLAQVQKPVNTSAKSDYYTTGKLSDYDPPAPPVPVAKEDGGEDDVLIVPKRAEAPAPVQTVPQQQSIITVAAGDTLYSLSRKHNVPLRDLITANKLEPPYALNPGRRLFLPSQFVHTVAKGETLYSISRLYQMDLNSLAQMNDLKEPFALSVGQKLVLPAQIQLTNNSPIADTPPANSPLAGESKPAETPVSVGGQKTEPTPTAQPIAVKKPASVSSLPKVPPRSAKKFAWPLHGIILSEFGAKSNGLYNDGINIKAVRGDPVSAAENGVVAYAGNEIKGLGNLVIIKHADNFMTVYAHLDTILVERGKTVARGAKIGSAGATGKVSSPQLHFELRQGTRALNPVNYLSK
ncbi:MAG: LysM peptidoglycan-binding domain-containing M23 family metallopeptidase [Rickettsiales bacterium]|jgi:murein DD-endopeptidase MepM/ murein hydrolase activator NlpD|nr:LysM peptidoglycan-binding domain-containing M23 family metallopeptidase [Rickettsiales bacterium]